MADIDLNDAVRKEVNSSDQGVNYLKEFLKETSKTEKGGFVLLKVSKAKILKELLKEYKIENKNLASELTNKYQNTAELPLENLKEFIREQGYGYILDLVVQDEKTKQIIFEQEKLDAKFKEICEKEGNTIKIEA